MVKMVNKKADNAGMASEIVKKRVINTHDFDGRWEYKLGTQYRKYSIVSCVKIDGGQETYMRDNCLDIVEIIRYAEVFQLQRATGRYMAKDRRAAHVSGVVDK